MKLSELFDFYQGKDLEFDGISINSKTIKKNEIFLCIKGINVDRHDYIDEAIENGAVAIISKKDIDINIPYIKIDNLDEIWPSLYEKFYHYPQNELNIIGITGTDGKTSITTIIQTLLGNDICGYIGTNGYNCKYFDKKTNNTTPGPESLYQYLREFLDHNIKYVALETSSEAFYHHRLDDINFISAGISNIKSEHLNTHKTLENYISCKKELFKKNKGYAILNSNDKYYEEFKLLSNNILSYGYKKEDDLYIKDYKCHPNKTDITFIYQNKEYNIISPLLAKFNIENLACALLICLSLDFKIEDLLKNISNLSILGRMQVIDNHQDFYCIVDFAHTPNALERLFEFTKTLKYNHLITIMGQPGQRDSIKRKDVGELLINNSDLAILTADDPRDEDLDQIFDMMLEKVKDANNYIRIYDRKEAIEYAFDHAEKNDLVLILGKGNERYMKINDQLIPFYDVEIANELLKKKIK